MNLNESANRCQNHNETLWNYGGVEANVVETNKNYTKIKQKKTTTNIKTNVFEAKNELATHTYVHICVCVVYVAPLFLL